MKITIDGKALSIQPETELEKEWILETFDVVSEEKYYVKYPHENGLRVGIKPNKEE